MDRTDVSQKWGVAATAPSDATPLGFSPKCEELYKTALCQFFVLLVAMYLLRPSFITHKRSATHTREIDIVKLLVICSLVVFLTFCIPLLKPPPPAATAAPNA